MNQHSNAPESQNAAVLYQVSLLQALSNGDYTGSVTAAELKQHGNMGIGTFDRLNGELIMLDGQIYRAAGDGRVEVVSDEETIPFSVITFMQTDISRRLTGIADFDSLHNQLEQLVAARGINRFYMIRIDGMFRSINLRSVYAQQPPYRRLVEVLEHDQTFFNYEHIDGTMVGLYCPPYMSYLNAVGWHFHFISKDKTKGGHVLGVQLDEAVLCWDDIDGFQLQLPQSKLFSGFDLTVDQSAELEKIEKNT